MGPYHDSNVVLKLYTSDGIERLCYQCWVAKQTNCGLNVQKYDLPEVHLIIEILSLIEKLCDVWLEFSIQRCELESPVYNLKVLIFFLVIVIRKVRV